MARKHQSEGPLQPLSLLDLNTPIEDNVLKDEMVLRGRMAQLGESYGSQVPTYDAILEICHTLKREGFDRLNYHVSELVCIKEKLQDYDPCNEDVIKYHALIQRTGGERAWTLRRHTGESRVLAYLPKILEASQMKMATDICLHSEHLEADESWISEDLTRCAPYISSWKEIGVLEFLNGCLPRSRVTPAQGPTSEVLAPIISERDESLTWKEATDEDNEGNQDVFLNRDGQPYMRTSGDIRVLYEARPAAVEPMPLGMFACKYRILKPSHESHAPKAYQKVLDEINPVTKVGPDSEDSIPGTSDRTAPRSMMLQDGNVMVKRSKGAEAVPRLLPNEALSKYSSILLWSPWRELESIRVNQEEVETVQQRQTRLDLFPLSVFNVCHDNNDESSDEILQ